MVVHATAGEVAGAVRAERDLVGELDVPADAYFGIHTLRAARNFQVTGRTVAELPGLVAALAAVKEAAGLANRELGLLDVAKADAIVTACAEIRAGALRDEFLVDPLQGGAGTSTNMNVNEVVANRALELLGRPKGDYATVHPIQDVNRAQSTNDVYPTALRVALCGLLDDLSSAVRELGAAVRSRAAGFDGMVKLGRTQLQDAVPMTLGQEFRAWAVTLEEEPPQLSRVVDMLCEVNLGGTAIGTGVTAHPGYRSLALGHLARITGVPVRAAVDLVEATSDAGVFVSASAAVKRTAVKVSKLCNDLRLLSSGPETSFGELTLRAVQGGSSIMPGKVNPVIPELVNQVAFEVVGNDVTVTMAAEAGQLQLNAFEPVIAYAVWQSATHLSAALRALTGCVAGITANEAVLHRNIGATTSAVTVLSGRLGYDLATALALEARTLRRPVRELAVERGLLSAAEYDAALASALGTTKQTIGGKRAG